MQLQMLQKQEGAKAQWGNIALLAWGQAGLCLV